MVCIWAATRKVYAVRPPIVAIVRKWTSMMHPRKHLAKELSPSSLPVYPCIVTDLISQWSALQSWTPETLQSIYGNRLFHCGVNMIDSDALVLRFHEALSLIQSGKYEHISKEPIYIFDASFDADCPELSRDYEVAAIFQDDVISLLPKFLRPDYKWFLMGGNGSGSLMHIDPLAMSAWNALVFGSKEWWIFTDVGADAFQEFQANRSLMVTDSLSSSTIDYHFDVEIPAFVNSLPLQRSATGSGYKFIQRPGEIVYLPRGCLHAVRNLGTSIAVTHNFVPIADHSLFLDEYRRSGHLSTDDMNLCENCIKVHVNQLHSTNS